MPMKMTYPRSSESDDRESPTDYYYADLTSNWNSDGDGMYGEFGALLGGDFSPTTSLPVHEVYVGRIPVYNADYAALDGILMKTINYERESDIAWRKNMLLPMAISNYDNEDGEGKSRTDGSSLGRKDQERSGDAQLVRHLHDVRKSRPDAREHRVRRADLENQRPECVDHEYLRNRGLVGARRPGERVSQILVGRLRFRRRSRRERDDLGGFHQFVGCRAAEQRPAFDRHGSLLPERLAGKSQ